MEKKLSPTSSSAHASPTSSSAHASPTSSSAQGTNKKNKRTPGLKRLSRSSKSTTLTLLKQLLKSNSKDLLPTLASCSPGQGQQSALYSLESTKNPELMSREISADAEPEQLMSSSKALKPVYLDFSNQKQFEVTLDQSIVAAMNQRIEQNVKDKQNADENPGAQLSEEDQKNITDNVVTDLFCESCKNFNFQDAASILLGSYVSHLNINAIYSFDGEMLTPLLFMFNQFTYDRKTILPGDFKTIIKNKYQIAHLIISKMVPNLSVTDQKGRNALHRLVLSTASNQKLYYSLIELIVANSDEKAINCIAADDNILMVAVRLRKKNVLKILLKNKKLSLTYKYTNKLFNNLNFVFHGYNYGKIVMHGGSILNYIMALYMAYQVELFNISEQSKQQGKGGTKSCSRFTNTTSTKKACTQLVPIMEIIFQACLDSEEKEKIFQITNNNQKTIYEYAQQIPCEQLTSLMKPDHRTYLLNGGSNKGITPNNTSPLNPECNLGVMLSQANNMEDFVEELKNNQNIKRMDVTIAERITNYLRTPQPEGKLSDQEIRKKIVNQLFFEACQAESVSRAASIILGSYSSQIEIDTKQSFVASKQLTPLLYMISEPHTLEKYQIAMLILLKNKPDLTATDQKGNNILHRMILTPYIKSPFYLPILDFLINKSEDFDINADVDGKSALILAVNQREAQAINLLVNSPNIDLLYRYTPKIRKDHAGQVDPGGNILHYLIFRHHLSQLKISTTEDSDKKNKSQAKTRYFKRFQKDLKGIMGQILYSLTQKGEQAKTDILNMTNNDGQTLLEYAEKMGFRTELDALLDQCDTPKNRPLRSPQNPQDPVFESSAIMSYPLQENAATTLLNPLKVSVPLFIMDRPIESSHSNNESVESIETAALIVPHHREALDPENTHDCVPPNPKKPRFMPESTSAPLNLMPSGLVADMPVGRAPNRLRPYSQPYPVTGAYPIPFPYTIPPGFPLQPAATPFPMLPPFNLGGSSLLSQSHSMPFNPFLVNALVANPLPTRHSKETTEFAKACSEYNVTRIEEMLSNSSILNQLDLNAKSLKFLNREERLTPLFFMLDNKKLGLNTDFSNFRSIVKRKYRIIMLILKAATDDLNLQMTNENNQTVLHQLMISNFLNEKEVFEIFNLILAQLTEDKIGPSELIELKKTVLELARNNKKDQIVRALEPDFILESNDQLEPKY